MAVKPLTDEQKHDAARLRAIFWTRQASDPALTQESLAHACDWKTQGAVNQYLLGKIPLNLRALIKFSRALNTPPESISPTLAEQIHSRPNPVLDTSKISPAAQQLIEEIIKIETEGSSSPALIEALSKVMHVALPSASANPDYAKLRDELAKRRT